MKTSGSKGLQVYVPLNTAVTYEQTKPFARAVAELLEKRHPELVVSRMTKELRAGQGADRLEPERPAQDDRLRLLAARARAPHDLHAAGLGGGRASVARSRREPELSAEPRALLERVERNGDLFAPLLSLAQILPDLSGEYAGGARLRCERPLRSP